MNFVARRCKVVVIPITVQTACGASMLIKISLVIGRKSARVLWSLQESKLSMESIYLSTNAKNVEKFAKTRLTLKIILIRFWKSEVSSRGGLRSHALIVMSDVL